jgi:hypothetical protein
MPAQRNHRSTRPAATRAGSTTARRGNGSNGNGRRNNRAAYWSVELSIGPPSTWWWKARTATLGDRGLLPVCFHPSWE